MTTSTPIEEVLRYLGVENSDLLSRLRGEGLFEQDEIEADEAEELRVAACLVHELGVNPAGVEVVLRMRRRLIVLEERTQGSLRRILDERDER